MSETISPLTGPRADDSRYGLRRLLKLLERKDWWHWCNAIFVIMLLTGAVAVLSLPKVITDTDLASPLELAVAVRGLLGLVLIFNIYTLYQQYLLKQLRSNLSNQIEVAIEQRVRAETYFELAIVDPLTGLYNRRFSEEHLRKQMASADRSKIPLIVLLLDLDNFKRINDQFGHAVGDLVLKEFSRRLNKAIRGSDVAVRLGGDEFLVILRECAPDSVDAVLSRIGTFEFPVGDTRISVSSSRGWVQYEAADTGEQLVGLADQALYNHKATRVQFALEPALSA